MMVWLCLSIALSVWVFSPILGVYFHNDDFIHLFNIVDLGFSRFVFEPFAMHSLVVRNALLYAVYQVFGPDPRASFAIVLLTHALNTGLLFAAVRTLTSSSPIAFFGATLWGTAPVLAGSLGWYTVYGHVLVGTCLAALLAALASAYAAARPPAAGRLIWSAVLAVAASACFGTGLGVSAAFPLLVLVPFPARRAGRLRLVLALLVPLVAGAAYFAVAWWQVIGDLPDTREAVWTTVTRGEPGTLLDSLRHLLQFGAGELLAGRFRSLRADSTMAVVWLLYAAALAATLLWSPATTRRLAVCLLLASIACYVPISLAKGGLATRRPTRLSNEARYHYASLMPLSILLALGIHAVATRWPESRRAGPWILAAWLGSLIASQALGPRPIDRHDRERQMVTKRLEEIRARVSAALPGQPVVIPDRAFAPSQAYLGLGSAALFLIHHPSGSIDGRAVRFSVPEHKLPGRQTHRRRVAELLVAE